MLIFLSEKKRVALLSHGSFRCYQPVSLAISECFPSKDDSNKDDNFPRHRADHTSRINSRNIVISQHCVTLSFALDMKRFRFTKTLLDRIASDPRAFLEETGKEKRQ